MNSASPNPTTNAVQQAAAVLIKDLYSLQLHDGLPAQTQHAGKMVNIAYKQLRLRETNVADERWAVQQAERAVLVNGAYQLLESRADYRLALTLRHCEAFSCEGQALPQSMVDLDTFGKLSSHDLALIEERIYLIELAAQVRYGALDEAAYKAIIADHIATKQNGGDKRSPQLESQATGVADFAAEPELGPAMLADYAGSSAQGGTVGLASSLAAASA
jgi:hypothetical protein